MLYIIHAILYIEHDKLTLSVYIFCIFLEKLLRINISK